MWEGTCKANVGYHQKSAMATCAGPIFISRTNLTIDAPSPHWSNPCDRDRPWWRKVESRVKEEPWISQFWHQGVKFRLIFNGLSRCLMGRLRALSTYALPLSFQDLSARSYSVIRADVTLILVGKFSSVNSTQLSTGTILRNETDVDIPWH